MAHNNTAEATTWQLATQAWGSALGRMVSGLRSAIVLTGSMNGRMRQIEVLNAKSDAELAAIGLEREDITRYVFRDIIYL